MAGARDSDRLAKLSDNLVFRPSSKELPHVHPFPPFAAGRRRRRLALAASALPAAAQNYPARPITLIVPWGAGGGTDATARIIGSLLEKDLGPAGHGGQPHRRQRRGRPRGHRLGAAGRLHHRPGHGGDRHDALAGPHRAHRRLVHADRPGQPRSGRHPGARRRALQDGEGPARRDQGQSGQVQGFGHGAGRHLAPGDRRPAARPEDRPGGGALGAEQRRGARACRTWWPAASRSRRARCPKRVR